MSPVPRGEEGREARGTPWGSGRGIVSEREDRQSVGGGQEREREKESSVKKCKFVALHKYHSIFNDTVLCS